MKEDSLKIDKNFLSVVSLNNKMVFRGAHIIIDYKLYCFSPEENFLSIN